MHYTIPPHRALNVPRAEGMVLYSTTVPQRPIHFVVKTLAASLRSYLFNTVKAACLEAPVAREALQCYDSVGSKFRGIYIPISAEVEAEKARQGFVSSDY